MTRVQALTPGRAILRSPSTLWVPAAAVLAGTGWGSNQFTPMLLVYHRTLGLGTGTLEAMFGLYALGLIPGLLVAGRLSDARGRRPIVTWAAGLSLAASVALAVAGHSVVLLFTGRAVAGLSNGAAFSAGTAWLRELSRPPLGSASEHGAARRAAVSMTAGFALGPLVSGLLAQWAPAPGVVPYLPHIALMVIVILLLPGLPETRTDGIPAGLRASLPGLASPRFRGVVAPMAPWVFAAPAIGFALLPSVVGANRAPDGIALTASITTLCALAGVMVQPFARRLDARVHANQAAITGLVVLAAGLTIGAVAAHEQQAWLLVPSSIILGAAYGLCLVAGLVEVQRLADQGAQAGLTAVYYALCYLGFAAPYLLAVAAQLASYAVMLVAMAALALVTASVVARHDGTLQGDGGR